MSVFTTALVATWMGVSRQGRPLYRLELAFSYTLGSEDSGLAIQVPAGFETDFASIPRAFWWLFLPASPRHGKAAVLHDWLYSRAGPDLGRALADYIFLEALGVLNVGWKRWLLWGAVRLFGAKAYAREKV